MKDPKVGERVAVYHGANGRLTGVVDYVSIVDNTINVRLDVGGDKNVHIKQCRRLVRKQKPERWSMEEIAGVLSRRLTYSTANECRDELLRIAAERKQKKESGK